MKKKALVVIPMVLIFVNVLRGVDAFDAHLGSRFNLKAMCIWNIHDFPTYKLLVGVVIKGHVGCPPCGPSINSSNSKKLKKIVYCGACKHLLRAHPYQWAWLAFNGGIETRVAPIRMSTTQTLEGVAECKSWLSNLQNFARRNFGPMHKHGIKRYSIMFELPCWQVCELP
jgi:hypothetical protein